MPPKVKGQTSVNSKDTVGALLEVLTQAANPKKRQRLEEGSAPEVDINATLSKLSRLMERAGPALLPSSAQISRAIVLNLGTGGGSVAAWHAAAVFAAVFGSAVTDLATELLAQTVGSTTTLLASFAVDGDLLADSADSATRLAYFAKFCLFALPHCETQQGQKLAIAVATQLLPLLCRGRSTDEGLGFACEVVDLAGAVALAVAPLPPQFTASAAVLLRDIEPTLLSFEMRSLMQRLRCALALVLHPTSVPFFALPVSAVVQATVRSSRVVEQLPAQPYTYVPEQTLTHVALSRSPRLSAAVHPALTVVPSFARSSPKIAPRSPQAPVLAAPPHHKQKSQTPKHAPQRTPVHHGTAADDDIEFPELNLE